MEAIDYTVDENVATITLNRPEKLNAFNNAMMVEIVQAFDLADADDNVRCVILTGAGRAFCAGADISSGTSSFDRTLPQPPEREQLRHGKIYRDGGGFVSLRIFASQKPVIAAVNGVAVGIGATMLLPADFRLTTTSAKFGFLFGKRGIVPEAASSWFLPRLVGISTALDWTLTGRMVDSAEAVASGLVRSLHEPADLMPAARALAKEISTSIAPVSAALTRQMMWRMLGASHPMEAHRADSRAIQVRGQSADAREGIASFKEKRPANFPDRVSTDLPDIWSGVSEPRFW